MSESNLPWNVLICEREVQWSCSRSIYFNRQVWYKSRTSIFQSRWRRKTGIRSWRVFFFKKKTHFKITSILHPFSSPKFVACGADIVDRRVMGRLRAKSRLVVERWEERSWESIWQELPETSRWWPIVRIRRRVWLKLARGKAVRVRWQQDYFSTGWRLNVGDVMAKVI